MSPWVYLIIAGLLEMCWAIGIKFTEGFTKPVPTILTVIAIIASMWMLGLASRDLSVGTAYAVWVGIGATGAAILGSVVFREPITTGRGMFLGLLVISIIGLKLTAPPPAADPAPEAIEQDA